MKESELNHIVEAKLNEFQLLSTGDVDSNWDKNLFEKIDLSKGNAFSKRKIQIAVFVLVILMNLAYGVQKIEIYRNEKTQQVLHVVSKELLINEFF